ncbi:hypothetical protein BJ912DRAFT_1070011 [Pholiota molesta]|nr:hypothetical protein BJ912DRAFT_1070011 [Pholiota molesta]
MPPSVRRIVDRGPSAQIGQPPLDRKFAPSLTRCFVLIPSSATRVIVLEQVFQWRSRWTPICLDIVTALRQRSSEQELAIQSGILGNSSNVQVSDILSLIENPPLQLTKAEPEPISNKHIKAALGYLRGTISEGLQDFSTSALAPGDGQLTKFQGIYQQDDRDIREEREAQGASACWLDMDQFADEHGNGTFKITARQAFQFRGVIKRHLQPAIQEINHALLDTLAACGDVNRNFICSSVPTISKLHEQVYQFAKEVSNHLIPGMTVYHEIWLDKKLVAGEALKDFEPLRLLEGSLWSILFAQQVAVAVPPTNDVDVFANNLGLIAIVGEDGELQGFNVTIGGGRGVTHGNKKTYPRLGSIIGFCTPEQGKCMAEKVMLVQRDNGNRADKNARLKCAVHRMGLEVYKAEVEKLLGCPLQVARAYTFHRNVDDFGWHTSADGKHHFTMFIENGRIADQPGKDFKTGLREIAKHLLVSEIADEHLDEIKTLLRKFKMDNLEFSGLRLSSSAYVVFLTCGLAMAESERVLPRLLRPSNPAAPHSLVVLGCAATNATHAANRTKLDLSATSVLAGILAAVIGWAGIPLNNRSFLAACSAQRSLEELGGIPNGLKNRELLGLLAPHSEESELAEFLARLPKVVDSSATMLPTTPFNDGLQARPVPVFLCSSTGHPLATSPEA